MTEPAITPMVVEEFVELGARREDFVEPVPAAPVSYGPKSVEITFNGVKVTGQLEGPFVEDLDVPRYHHGDGGGPCSVILSSTDYSGAEIAMHAQVARWLTPHADALKLWNPYSTERYWKFDLSSAATSRTRRQAIRAAARKRIRTRGWR